MSNIKIAIVYFSKYGHTRLQAEAVRDGAASFKGSDVLRSTPPKPSDASTSRRI